VKGRLHPNGGSLQQPRRQAVSPRSKPRLTGWRLNLPALGLILVFAVIGYGGANVLSFERLKGRLDSLRGPSIDSMLGPISAWKDTPGVAGLARRLALNVVVAETPADITGVENALDDVLTASPTAADTWQTRVAYLQARGSTERVLASFRMSALTGSHEPFALVERAGFGLEHWSELPEAERRIIIRDVVQALGSGLLADGDDRYRAILAEKSKTERDGIRSTFIAAGLGRKDVLKALGL
jgi:hypothetical protein